jgi:hypothetical protein
VIGALKGKRLVARSGPEGRFSTSDLRSPSRNGQDGRVRREHSRAGLAPATCGRQGKGGRMPSLAVKLAEVALHDSADPEGADRGDQHHEHLPE